ncbi:MAG: hypothetical protein Q9162_000207 [Coniocarpon cinnabarinum]
MSFFGFDPTKPPSQTHNKSAPGFGPTPDPFAGLSRRENDDAQETLNFDDDDGLGNDLEEVGDDYNDATFGSTNVGTDFDFSGQGAAQQRSQSYAQAPAGPPQPFHFPSLGQPQAPQRPAQTGYEKYKRPTEMRDLQPDANIWGLGHPASQAKPQAQQELPSIAKVTKSMMTLDEVEAAMRDQSKKQSPAPDARALVSTPAQLPTHSLPTDERMSQGVPSQASSIDQRQMNLASAPFREQQAPRPVRGQTRTPTSAQQPLEPSHPAQFPSTEARGHSPQLFQNADQPNQQMHRRGQSDVTLAQLHHRGPSLNGQPVTDAGQITQLSEEERAAFLREEANRAKRNHKIHMLSKDNGLMTPQDKNFITRIQLSQLVQAIGGAEEDSPEASHAEDFYYQVYSQIYAAAIESGIAPDSFTQTYLNQLSWKGGSRRYPRGGENHMRRMQQQVQRAVEAAKSRPKNKQLVVEGSLGKISFSNAKTPKPLLNIKRQDSHDPTSAHQPKSRPQDSVGGRKAILRDIENVYNSLMEIEDCERKQPPQPQEESSGDEIQAFMDWRHRFTRLNQKLWNDWRVHAPIDNDSSTPHPFMAMMSHPKGKKLVPRVFRQIDDQQRLTVLTITVVQLDQLDVIRDVQPVAGREQLPLNVRHEADLFTQAVEPSLFAYISDASLSVVTGLVGLVCQRVNIQMVIQARAGVNLLTRFLSRAIQLVQGTNANAQDSEQWTTTFNSFFDKIEPFLPNLFLSVITPGEDFFVWQFLAACGILSSPDQQPRLVIAVKDHVMQTVETAKKLPEPQGQPDLDKVNLFMHAIGLDVDLLG